MTIIHVGHALTLRPPNTARHLHWGPFTLASCVLRLAYSSWSMEPYKNEAYDVCLPTQDFAYTHLRINAAQHAREVPRYPMGLCLSARRKALDLKCACWSPVHDFGYRATQWRAHGSTSTTKPGESARSSVVNNWHNPMAVLPNLSVLGNGDEGTQQCDCFPARTVKLSKRYRNYQPRHTSEQPTPAIIARTRGLRRFV